jgi:hypothetical protein
MKLGMLFLTVIAPVTTTLTLASVSRADEASDTPVAIKGPRAFAGVVSVEPFTRLASRDGGQLTLLPSVDLLALVAVQERWNFYGGVGLGLFDARARAGLHVHPLGRSRSGPIVLVGARAIAGVMLMDAPSPDAPPTAPGGPPVTWSYTSILGEAGLGWRVARPTKDSDIYVVPTFLGGRVHYATGGLPSSQTWSGSAMYYGGTLALAFEW